MRDARTNAALKLRASEGLVLRSTTDLILERTGQTTVHETRASAAEDVREVAWRDLLASPLVRSLVYVQEFPRPRTEVFRFFEDALNLDAITPPTLRFRILTAKPIDMRAGALIDYSLRLRGVPIHWRTRIEVYEAPVRFVDRQLRGPYRLWWHEHVFEEIDGGTRMTDRVSYITPLAGNWLGRWVHQRFIRPDLEHIFAFRREKLAAIFGAMAGASAGGN